MQFFRNKSLRGHVARRNENRKGSSSFSSRDDQKFRPLNPGLYLPIRGRLWGFSAFRSSPGGAGWRNSNVLLVHLSTTVFGGKIRCSGWLRLPRAPRLLPAPRTPLHGRSPSSTCLIAPLRHPAPSISLTSAKMSATTGRRGKLAVAATAASPGFRDVIGDRGKDEAAATYLKQKEKCRCEQVIFCVSIGAGAPYYSRYSLLFPRYPPHALLPIFCWRIWSATDCG